MGSITDLDKDNIIPSTIEHLPEDVHRMLQEHKKKRDEEEAELKKKRDEEDLQPMLVSFKVDRRGNVTKIKEIAFASTSADAYVECTTNAT
ncbi:metal tolerance protein 7 isoform X3 [Panicum miliaceum]|uniref:Metal tolerance protein 7 isoform X3 n=1 Tax=Panicum miliaceum TaxID=4540 RepID=A0A3L6RZS6_PANMI|nr:metal tolerance protein 7 isoform X3 [Panicum miliaceum]